MRRLILMPFAVYALFGCELTDVTSVEGDLATNPPGESGTDQVALSVDIDIKPASVNNVVSLQPRGLSMVPVAILGTESFDVLWVDVSTVAFGPGEAEPVHDVANTCASCGHHLQDVDGDGVIDLVLHFRVQEAFDPSDAAITEACLDGLTLDDEGIPEEVAGVPFSGCDAVRLVSM
ncbi:MAG: hypothetical protein JSU87_01010 [Gemmatimonadota bacterium]|nr:MAG: hypothetical protein JSU87_01010 [Gemmatimonadota bacterium]